ncbi:hypothetical protein RI129_002765 [Pyrocoelia pectoralis]|uniref:Uncharacterized protein n=1 Tax=Pyrocoelia pectoralis TaxID=417401 RepID=A0AAN7ZU33_9COLE
MYGLKQLKNINDARVALFKKTYKFLDNDHTFRLPKKGIDGSALPPCKSELYEHFLRSCYIAQIWSHAHLKVPITDEPSNYGWVEIDNRYELKWFSGSQLPTSINQITIQHEKDTSNSDSESETEGDESNTSQSGNRCLLCKHEKPNVKRNASTMEILE